ncbi:RNA-directed DNA polymerase [Thermopolyspora sp. NPDC052614]|uniref:RNA-directed DNA polymerase n=1 Tax=Thermopolyspora sp. NPDC052614 TaxID=3155682 RepID=UPI003419E384
MPLIDKSTFTKAIANIARWGDTDIFPFPIENHMFHDRSSDIADLLADVANDFDNHLNLDPVFSYSTLAPVGYTGFRWATQIDPLWNAYLLSLVLALAPEIERFRIPAAQKHVFSYRYQPNGDGSLFAAGAWSDFQKEARRRAELSRYVIAVDIADFYSRIYHHRLENSLREVDAGGMHTRQIMAILSKLSRNTSYGLPVGGPAARLLSELVLDRVDDLLAANPSTANFCRYADDYRFFVNDMQTAYRAIGFVSEKLLVNEGLSLQKGKTRIMSSSEYLATLDPPNPPEGSAAKFLGLHIHFDPYSPTATEDYFRLKDKLHEFDILALLREELTKGRIHAALARRLISALQYMDTSTRKQAVISLLENIDILAPVIPQVMLAVRSTLTDIDDPNFVDGVHDRIRQLITSSHYAANIALNLAFMIRVLASHRSLANEQLFIAIFDRTHGFGSGPAPNIKRDIVLAMARWRAAYWLSDLKNYVSAADPWVKRAFIVASYALGDEGKHWRDANKHSLRPFDKLLRDWAASKVQVQNWQVPI